MSRDISALGFGSDIGPILFLQKHGSCNDWRNLRRHLQKYARCPRARRVQHESVLTSPDCGFTQTCIRCGECPRNRQHVRREYGLSSRQAYTAQTSSTIEVIDDITSSRSTKFSFRSLQGFASSGRELTGKLPRRSLLYRNFCCVEITPGLQSSLETSMDANNNARCRQPNHTSSQSQGLVNSPLAHRHASNPLTGVNGQSLFVDSSDTIETMESFRP
ncbi:hypothetical protein K470DRAFT_86609 [Piedraia hortae CBS 480.64]|uniref:Uncharacterized protein n=1 Tax=Piedraia hortae CBS 480.64 TaxID=1314780 RepID=A0A6A7BZT1_9PEZI|nr:hypothetical protein K470DRAFT_86609 [Piedraia hortae CBS 480.64]